MPELPEVESIKLQLRKFLIGHKIENVEVRYRKKFEGDENNLIGGKITNIRRFGKVQSIDLDNGYSILIHIKLTGQLIYRGPNLSSREQLSKKITGGLGGKHTHVIFYLDESGVLYYNDVRKFGWIHIVKTSEIEKHKYIEKLGPEPLVNFYNPPEVVLTIDKFEKILSNTHRAIKIVLMDQAKIGGVGNIYANDALWLAKINPKTPANKLNRVEVKGLYNAIHKVLKNGLKYGGASELAYVTPDGKEGEYQNHTLVYGHEGQPCERCHKSKIKKFFLSGRGTYCCPVCQK